MNAPHLLAELRDLQEGFVLDGGSNGTLMSLEEFAALTHDDCDPRFRYESLNGVVIVSPPPDDATQGPNERLGNWLWDYQQRHPNGKVLDDSISERAVRTKVGMRIVDRALWIGFGRPIKSKRDRATILVEFVSPGKRSARRDHEQKRNEYLEFGAKEYWVIDRFRRTLTVYFALPADPPSRVVSQNEMYTTPLLPGFELSVKRLMELADQYADEE